MEQKWEQIYIRLMKASLLAGRDVKQLLLEHPDLDLLLSKLESKKIKGMLSPKLLEEITQEINDKILNTKILKPGDISITYEGGHKIDVLKNNTIIYEHKTGPYEGQKKDLEIFSHILI